MIEKVIKFLTPGHLKVNENAVISTMYHVVAKGAAYLLHFIVMETKILFHWQNCDSHRLMRCLLPPYFFQSFITAAIPAICSVANRVLFVVILMVAFITHNGIKR